MDAKPMRAHRNLARRTYDLVAAADVEVVHQMTVLDVEAVTRGGIAMRDQHALGPIFAELDMGLDGVTTASHIRCGVGRHVPPLGVEGEMVASAVEAGSILCKARPEAIVERQHLMLFRLAPPHLDHVGKM